MPHRSKNAPSTGAALLVGLMALSLFINYIDRGNLATGATQIRADLNLSLIHI